MKVVFDTNIYISWIRERKYPELLLNRYTQKYISCIVLTELWAGAKTKPAIRLMEKLQQPYLKAGRVSLLSANHCILAGQILSDFPDNYRDKVKAASFVNDIYIGLTAVSIGAVLYTENKEDFEIIREYLKKLRVQFV